MKIRDHNFLGVTSSLCPECLRVVPAKIIVRGERVYFKKRCPEHGEREDFVCSDVTYFDQMQFAVPGKIPAVMGAEVDKGCPLDCGLCTEHEQHTCVGLVELTADCNLKCPMCYASSGPGGKDVPAAEVRAAIDRLVTVEGRAEVCQLSGGEPTIHPEFAQILEHACASAIDIVMVNTNGLTIARDDRILDLLERFKKRIEVYLQFDGFSEDVSQKLRGARIADDKLRAIERLGARGIRTTLVCTVQAGVNDQEIGAILKFAAARPHITGVSYQPATYTGRNVKPETLEARVTFPDVVKAIEAQTDGLFRVEDFMPLPCAHPNCHTLTYAYREGGRIHPLLRFIDAREHVDLLANGITFNRAKGRQLVEDYLKKTGCADDGCSGIDAWVSAIDSAGRTRELPPIAWDFFRRAVTEEIAPEDILRVTITSFLDAYNFDVRRVMKCCIHHVLPSGHVIPFCAYNVLYREGHAALPKLVEGGIAKLPESVVVGDGNEPRLVPLRTSR